MILPKQRDPRLITVRRGGSLSDEHHHLLALWAADCAAHVLPLFTAEQPENDVPQQALDMIHAWTRGEVSMREAHNMAFRTNAAGKGCADPARFAALAAGQAVAVAHVAAHQLGAAAYAIRAQMAVAAESDRERARVAEKEWQIARLPGEIRDLVLDDQKRRNSICWNVFA